jgi:threonine synthase
VGIGCEPASAASLAGIRKLVAAGKVSPDATIVGVVTGHVLKDTDAISLYHLEDLDGAPRRFTNRPLRVPATVDALKKVLDDAVLG